MEEQPEIDFDDFLEELFKNSPKDKNSIALTLDCDDIITLFERLLSIFHYGSIYLFGDENKKVSLDKMSPDDFMLINKYFNSFGVKTNFKVIRISDYLDYKAYIKGENTSLIFSNPSDNNYSRDICMEDIITYKYCTSVNLYDYKFRLYVGDRIYILWFNYEK